MIITEIRKAAKTKNKANIYIDGEYKFSLFLSDIADLNLKVGQKIDKALDDKIQQTILYKNALNDSLRMIARADCPEKKIVEKLTLKEYPEQTIKKVISYLTEKGYLNDYEYAKKYIKNAVSAKKKGKAYIELELYKRGISREDISSLLEMYYSSDGIYDIAKSKLEKLKEKNKNYNIALRKLREYLLRQGFSFDEINKVQQELSGEDICNQ